MKTILVLGGYGFLGTNILKYMDSTLANSCRAIVFDRCDSHLAGESFSCVEKSYSGDFRDTAVLESIFAENAIDYVIHSLSTTIPLGGYNPRYDIESNLLPTLSVLDLMLKYNVRDIAFFSSGGAVYGDLDRVHDECEDVFPVSSYGIVKYSIEKYLMQYARLFGIRPLILRLSNPFGEYHYSMRQGICNVAVASAIKGDEFTVYGDGTTVKDYIYVRDFVDILFRLIDENVHNEVVNVASGQLVSINEILARVKLSFPSFRWVYQSASPYDVSRFALNTSKLRSLIGSYKFTPFVEGMERTIKWAKNQL